VRDVACGVSCCKCTPLTLPAVSARVSPFILAKSDDEEDAGGVGKASAFMPVGWSRKHQTFDSSDFR